MPTNKSRIQKECANFGKNIIASGTTPEKITLLVERILAENQIQNQDLQAACHFFINSYFYVDSLVALTKGADMYMEDEKFSRCRSIQRTKEDAQYNVKALVTSERYEELKKLVDPLFKYSLCLCIKISDAQNLGRQYELEEDLESFFQEEVLKNDHIEKEAHIKEMNELIEGL